MYILFLQIHKDTANFKHYYITYNFID